MRIQGRIVDIVHRRIIEGSVDINNGIITAIDPHPTNSRGYILPGFVDAHVHIESSMLTPVSFGQEAIKHGVVAVVTDPHEIANVCGVPGIEYMVSQGKDSSIKCFFTVPSCVPATSFDHAGAVIDAQQIEELISRDDFVALSEMMDYPAVVADDAPCMAKLAAAHRYSKPIDGHAPTLSGADLKRYVEAGVSTDHECYTIDNALEKIGLGMSIQIREGSLAKNFDTLIPLLTQYPDRVMFCCDDIKAIDLRKGYINSLVARAVSLGYDLYDVLRAASYNAIHHYNLTVGLLQVGDPADFIVCDNLEDFTPSQVWINGKEVDSSQYKVDDQTINNFQLQPITLQAIETRLIQGMQLNVIGVVNNQLITDHLIREVGVDIGYQKIVVLNRYNVNTQPAIGFVEGFNCQNGAIASTIAHDSHNIIATGSSDELILSAINEVIRMQGGVVACLQLNMDSPITITSLPLPIAGVMSPKSANDLISEYQHLTDAISRMGCPLSSPLMTLAFMALPVIPSLKITDQGLFDVDRFEPISYIR